MSKRVVQQQESLIRVLIKLSDKLNVGKCGIPVEGDQVSDYNFVKFIDLFCLLSAGVAKIFSYISSNHLR